MHDRIHTMICKHFFQQGLVCHVTLNESAAGYQRCMACGQVVQDDNIVTILKKALDHVRSNISGPTDNENVIIHSF